MKDVKTSSDMPPNVLIIGKDGMLAHVLGLVFTEQGISHKHLCRPGFDILADSPETIDLAPYNIVINAAGLTNRWESESTEQDFETVNVEFPHRLARHCQKNHVQMIHISTDCVFTGKNGAPYTESSPSDATSLYGTSKQRGEPVENALVIRTSIIGPEIKNHYSLMSWVQSQVAQDIPGFTNHWWNGVTTYELSNMLAAFIKSGQTMTGLRHLHSPDDVTKAELVRLLVAALNMENTSVIDTEDSVAIDRRLATDHKELAALYTIRPIATQINDMTLYMAAK